MCQQAKRLGCLSVELVDPKDWPTLKKHGLVCAIAGSHGFEKGMNSPKYQEMCIEKMRAAIDACARRRAIPTSSPSPASARTSPTTPASRTASPATRRSSATPRREESDAVPGDAQQPRRRGDEGASRLPGRSHRLLHENHQAGRLAASETAVRYLPCADHGRRRDPPHRVRTPSTSPTSTRPAIPGGRELDDKQEINYPPIMQALVEAKYTGYVGQEFIPTRDPAKGLEEAVALCDV